MGRLLIMKSGRRISLIRHAESCANVGLKTSKPAEIRLTYVGQQQARELDDLLWSHRPGSFLPHGLQGDEHTDSDGGNSHNLQLSKARAKAVADALILHGVGTESITAKGYGENKPIASNETAEGKAINRRVELGITVDGFRVADR